MAAEEKQSEALLTIPSNRRNSARNLIHYLALRAQDLRRLQVTLAHEGLSSLGRCEAHVLATVQRLQSVIQQLSGQPTPDSLKTSSPSQMEGPNTLKRQAHKVFGPLPKLRSTRIMVTLPGEAVQNPTMISQLLEAGMDLARINCAHDDVLVWQELIRLVRDQAKKQGRTCVIMMDLAGPKLRTGAVGSAEPVVAWSPKRDHRGRVLHPSRIAFVPNGSRPSQSVDAVVPTSKDLSEHVQIGDQISCHDARGKRRRMRVVFVGQQEVVAEASATGYLVNGLTCHVERDGRRVTDAKVIDLPLIEAPLLLNVGDTLLVTADQRPGHLAQRDSNGSMVSPATIPCTLPEIFAQVVINERICFDDGRIEGIIRAVDQHQLTVEITRARDGGAKLRSAKGINLPDSLLNLPCLSLQDRDDLEFAKKHADIVGLSFVHQPSDVTDLMTAIGSNPRPLQVVLKIETPQAFAQFPAILLASLGKIPVGVMIARGDLAVEVGFNRLAEVQEEILWLCEAAHIPVIWGTQVLENLAKKGMPTRAEVTDAAMSVRAECVMLNKGPHIVSAVTFLNDILIRMQQHQQKKRTLMRRLMVSHSIQNKQRKTNAGVK